MDRIRVHMFSPSDQNGTLFVKTSTREEAAALASNVVFFNRFETEPFIKEYYELIDGDYAREVDLEIDDRTKLLNDTDLGEVFRVLAQESEGARKEGFVPDSVSLFRLTPKTERIPEGWVEPRLDNGDDEPPLFLMKEENR